MGFNVDKCNQLAVTRKINKTDTSYTLHRKTLEKVKDAKYLGVEISENLSWKTHINSITGKANKSSAYVHCNLKGCSKQIQAHCFKTISRPILEYASSVWDPHQKGLENQIEMVQRPMSSASYMVPLSNTDTYRYSFFSINYSTLEQPTIRCCGSLIAPSLQVKY